MKAPVIIGTGISGLSAANYFVDHGIQPIIIEAGTIGRTKICGEFFSYESIPFLEKWDIPFLEIKKSNFITPLNNYSFNFPMPYASTQRSMCELELSKRAVNLGATLYENSLVEEIIPAKQNNGMHYIKLSSGKVIETNKLIITTSKISNTAAQTTDIYVGIKSHFTNIDMPNELNMFIIPGAYMGVTYINSSDVNICCLAKKKLVDQFESLDLFIQYFINSHVSLKNLLKNSKQIHDPWLTGTVNAFGKKNNPNWPNTYFIGDAAATIFPASGNGLAMGLTAGVMAAEHIINNLQTDFKKQWHNRYNKRLSYAKILHSLFISPYKADIAFKITNSFPFISNIFYKLTRD